jgi:HemY protein
MTKTFWSKFFLCIKLIILFGIILVLYHLPGKIIIHWNDYEIELATAFLAIAGFILLGAILLFHRLYLGIKNIPRKWQLRRENKLKRKAQKALHEGFNALAAEDYQEAKDQVQKLERLDESNPLSLILKTQIAFASGNKEEAEKSLKQLSNHSELSFLGLRGLIMLEEGRPHQPQLHQLLMEALKVNPQSPWVLQKLFDWNIRHALFDQAEIILEQLQITHFLEPQQINRRKALLAWAEADVAYREQEFDVFYESILRALDLMPELTEATFRLAQYYSESERLHKALKTLHHGYAAQPNPEYGIVLQQVHSAATRLDLYQEAEKMTGSHPNHRYSHQILAKLAIDAKLWGQAKKHLAELNKHVLTKSYYQLMALLETQSHPDQPHLAKTWLDQAALAPHDATWVCEGCTQTLDRWFLVCPSCHGIDTISWEGIPGGKGKKPSSLLLETYS